MNPQIADPKKPEPAEPAFQGGFPSCTHGDVFEIKLHRMGDMAGPVVMLAQADLSTQYRAEGKQWIARESAGGFSSGITIPSIRVEGWRNRAE